MQSISYTYTAKHECRANKYQKIVIYFMIDQGTRTFSQKDFLRRDVKKVR